MTYTPPDPSIALTSPDDYVRACFVQIPAAARNTPEARRRLTKLDPLLFSLVYFRDSLRAEETGNQVTLSQFHVDIATSARKWAKANIGLQEIREAWVAPRGVGKSTWAFLILPAWALAHGHRKFVMAFADNSSMAQGHLATFKRKVQTSNDLLRKDFPDLCSAARRPGGVTDSDRQDQYLAKNGAVFAAKGIESTTLGAKVGDQRPDLLLFDDVEPPADQYSPGQKEGRLSLILEAVLPMNLNAVVQFVGTVTMEGSIMHDIVRRELEGESASEDNAWVKRERITTCYYPAIVTQDDGTSASLWPARWPLESLEEMRVSMARSFAMNYMNQPVPLNSAYWVADMFHREIVPGLTRHIISVDPAVTTSKSADFTGLAVLSWSASERRISLRHAEAVKLPPNELRTHLLQLCQRFPEVQLILVETNQGGDTWKDSVFHHMPAPVHEVKQSVKKELRWAQVLDLWSRRIVTHELGGTVLPFERQALLVPKSAHDDIVDAVTSGVAFFRDTLAKATPKKRDRVASYV